LGAGAMAAYAQPGERWTFFEIDPAVVHLASPEARLFTFLQRSRGKIAIDLGDARLSLQKDDGKFGLFIVDAFGGDAIPMHLSTREALQLHPSELDEVGLLVLHISNRHLDREPVLANLAATAEPKLPAWIARDLVQLKDDEQTGRAPSIWMVLARRPEDLAKLPHGALWRWQTARARPELRPWTDDFSNLWQVFRWGSDKD